MLSSLFPSAHYLFSASAALYLAGAAFSLAFRGDGGRRLSSWSCAAGSLAGILLAASILSGGESLVISLPQLTPFSGFSFLIDPLAALFIGIIAIVSFPLSIYTLEYAREYSGRANFWMLGTIQNLFILSMVLVVSANNAVLFLVIWEIMSILSYFLVNFEHEKQEANRAGFIYLIMTHAGTAFIMLSFLVMFHFSGSFSFDSFKASAIPPFYQGLAFIFALIGFGTKAGIVPLHVWLPRAHPAAPSNISALMSGVMVKTAIYMMIRVVFGFLGGGYAWWGLLILAIGTVSALLGVLYAIVEQDIKRLLAYSTVENIGIILMGLGASIIFTSFGNMQLLASIAMTAALLHSLNHALFKSLLFMGAGSILYSTHTKNMEELGGLARTMPVTAIFFFAGIASISALPLFNGFISEWLLLQSLLAGAATPSLLMKIVLPISGALLALTGGLAALCFAKAFGITFLGNPRSEHAKHAKEAPAKMRLGMGLLALACLAIGILPAIAIAATDPVTHSLFGTSVMQEIASFSGITLSSFGGAGISPLALMALLVSAIPLAFGLTALIGGKTKTRKYGTWDCGFAGLGARHEYSGTAYSQPTRAIFADIYDQKDETTVTSGKVTGYSLKIGSLFERHLYAPLAYNVLRIAALLQRMQTGSTRTYLIYIFAALVALLASMRWM